jgi:signal transduction histidine kinase/CheY-like chemotaxis protein
VIVPEADFPSSVMGDPARGLLELLPVGVYACAAPSGTITYFNREAAELWGRAPEIGSTNDRFCGSFKMLVPGTHEVLPHDRCPMAIALREGCSFRNEEVIVERPDKSRVRLMVNIDPIRSDPGDVVGAINVFSDMTGARRTENAFLATLSHELRNPLSPMLAGLEIIRLAPDEPAKVQAARAVIERQVLRLVSLVDDLLDVSRINVGRFALRKRRTSVADVARGAVDDAEAAGRAAGHAVTLALPASPVYSDVDAERIGQVLDNLLDNAMRYTPRGGTITVGVSADASDAVIVVRDTGLGIAPERLEGVFDMFAASGPGPEWREGGLGIGLGLAKAIVSMHGGSIRAESGGTGFGSTFTVRLPLAESRPTEPAAPDTGLERSAHRRRVLIVDDNDAIVESLSCLIEMLGNDVRVASDGVRAVELAEEFRPDIVLMDLSMPRMSGYEAARRIRTKPWGGDVTLVALTGRGQEEDKQRTRESGFDHHLVKPARPADLKRLLAG